ncbi:dihydroxyacetone kinase phosphoryl donor subunit DhaM [Inquilinus limosus]|uniref:phosphoenolpyruvate--glycerone phosphotransferase n=1 Tax=Inquilinus limosus TaxID=171674 RepID=A0A211ZEZ8_9PROT|nr:dihydroxyacetone kinase phosphoryl donor subunit DhaM [Inquilinus limosus]OWJ63734.1 PTS mannose transporter subunit IID [Inquilinus limosus]
MPESNGHGRARVSIVIVSHSPAVAKGTADLVRQMTGDDIGLEWCGGDPAGGLGSDAEAIGAAIEKVWSKSGVAIFVDLGGTEMNVELAIERMPQERRRKVVVCDAPIVEGAVVAGNLALSGANLRKIRSSVEEQSGI